MGENIKDRIGLKEYLTGKYEAKDFETYFAKAPKQYAVKLIYLRKEVLSAFLKMADAAEKEGIHLNVLSGFRSYRHQKAIWERKYDATFLKNFPDKKKRFYEILKYSAAPGVSRHHWGTDLDILSLDGNYFLHGKGKRQKQWLDENASKYGFYLVYTPGRKGGYYDEAWHYTYKPLSDKILPLVKQLRKEDVLGFHGDENIVSFDDFIETYMFNINPILLP